MTTGEPFPAVSPRTPVRVVLVNYRCADHIERLLAGSLFESSDEIVVVDNASDPDRVVAWGERFGVRTELAPTNLGFAKAVNLAVTKTALTSAPILLLNPDAHLSPEQLSSLLQTLTATRADGVAPLLLDERGGVQVGAAGGPLSLTTVATYFLLVSHLITAAKGIFHTRRQLRAGGGAAWLCMACLLVRPDAFDRFGRVPEDELVYAEDIAWGTRATELGARFLLVPTVAVLHEQGASGGASVWADALRRLYVRRLGRVRGRAAVGVMDVGLSIRRLLGRKVDR